jgi:3-oxo-5alpha-steroid 4-dehydrogenase
VYAGGGTSYQKAVGFDDTPDEMLRYLEQEVGDAVAPGTLRRFCQASREMIRWLEDQGVPFEASLCPFKTSYPTDDYYMYFSGNEQAAPYKSQAKPAPRGHRAKGKGTSGRVLTTALERSARAQGVQVRTQTEVQRLITDGNRRIVGLIARTIAPGSFWAVVHARLSKINAKAVTYAPAVSKVATAMLRRITERRSVPYRVRARNGVILAAGGFVFNREMVKRYAPIFLRCMPLGTIADDGAGIRLGESVGGATACMEHISAWRFYVPPEVLMQGVLVNRAGQRICNEDLYGAAVGEQIVAHGGDAFLILDSDTYRLARSQLRRQAARWQVLSILPMLLTGRKKASTLEELADLAHISTEGLLATMAAYNEQATSGKPDPLGKAESRFVPHTTAPFYALDCSLDASKGVPVAAMTLGGLVVDEDTGLVKREDGSVIEGLYAAGRNAVGLCSNGYVSGLSIADAVFSGRRAGRHAAGAPVG